MILSISENQKTSPNLFEGDLEMNSGVMEGTCEPLMINPTENFNDSEVLEKRGILVPCSVWKGSESFQFKLETDDKPLLLQLKGGLGPLAKDCLWDEVIVKGCFGHDGLVFRVYEIRLASHFDYFWLDEWEIYDSASSDFFWKGFREKRQG